MVSFEGRGHEMRNRLDTAPGAPMKGSNRSLVAAAMAAGLFLNGMPGGSPTTIC